MNDTLIYGIATMGFAFLAVLLKYTFKSKCSDVKICCGLISIKRDTEAEVKAEELELRNLPKKQESQNNLNNCV